MIAKKCTLATKTSLSIQLLTQRDHGKITFVWSDTGGGVQFFLPQGMHNKDYFSRGKPGSKYSNNLKGLLQYASKVMGIDLSLLSPGGDDDENKSPNVGSNVGSNVDSTTSIPR